MMQIRFLAILVPVLLASCASTSQTQNLAGPASSGGSGEREVAVKKLSEAIKRQDYRQAMLIENDWSRRFPSDLEFRRFEPMLYVLAGDAAGWERTRTDLLQSWRRIRGTVPPPANPSFTIDVIKVGQDTIVADQCYERAGRFGVIYRFTVLSADQRVHSFFTVESSDSDNQVARELGQSQQVFTLDHFRPGVHETVAMLPGLPPYADLRRRVLAYTANSNPISASSDGSGRLSTEGCSVDLRQPKSAP